METWSRKALKEKAKIRLKANYWKAVLVGMLALVIGGGSSVASSASGVSSDIGTSEISDAAGSAVSHGIGHISTAEAILIVMFALAFVLIVLVITFVAQILLFNPLEIGSNRFFHINLEENADIKEVCYAFDRGYKNSVKVMFFRDLYVFLWSLLFVIPGIIKSYEYRMIPYILGENPDMDKEQVFALSKQMMDGNKWDTFVLDLSFFLWDILGACTLGILNIFYVEPYRRLTRAGLYQALKEEQMFVRTENITDGQ